MSPYIFRKPCSDYKMKEMTGSGIFKGKGENGTSEAEEDEENSPKRVYKVYL